jgi:predicted neutral ceramidase superfamily lipid hydrolase
MSSISRVWPVNDPRRLLLLDAMGALVTFVMTEFLLASGLVPTGLPAATLHVLAYVAAGLFCVALAAHRFAPDPRRALGVMAIANLVYCSVTVMACVLHSTSLTLWGLIYFPAELVLVALLVFREWELSAQPRSV